jgi:protein gp37
MRDSKIQWTDHTFNPWVGCTKVSPGCDHCYAEAMMDTRMGKVRWGAGQPRQRTTPAYWRQPLRWNEKAKAAGERHRVFCASLADVFDNEVDPAWRGDLFDLIYRTPDLDWLLLTKRIGNAAAMIEEARVSRVYLPRWWPWPNVWIGATVVNQEEADRDIPKLLAVPAAVRFLSIEPILGPISLAGIPVRSDVIVHGATEPATCHLDWAIVGGESGPKARPTQIGWIRDIVAECKTAGVPVFVKQLGAQPRGWCSAIARMEPEYQPLYDRDDYCDIYEAHEGRCDGKCLLLEHPKGGDPDEWPDDLRVREFPAMKTRRHHNNTGRRQIQRGKTRDQVRAIAKRLGVPYGKTKR